MKRNFAVPILIVLLAIAAPAAPRAQGEPPAPPAGARMGMHGMPGHAGMMEGLDLSAEQKTRLEDVHFRHQKKAIAMRADLQLAQLDLERLMHSETPDERAIDTQIDRVSGLRAAMHKSGVAAMFEARAILTPEQRKLWREHHGMMPGGMMHGGMMRGGMHGPMKAGHGSSMNRDGDDQGMEHGPEGDEQ
jgi:Spy/CpxP family protein refolding chaperone